VATILIVDDRPSNREFLTTLLGYGGHTLIEAADGARALELVRTLRPDLVITDILMPTMDGYEFVQRLRSDPELASTNVMFHTATYSEPEAVTLAKACGVRTVLPKPSEPEEIVRAVNQTLDAAAAPLRDPGAIPWKLPSSSALQPARGTQDAYLKELTAAGAKVDPNAATEAKAVSEKLSQNVVRLQRILSRLSALIEVGMEMERERDPARLVKIFFGAACEIVNAKFAAIALLDDMEQGLRYVYTKGLDASLFADLDRARQGLIGSMLKQVRPLRVDRIDPVSDAHRLPAGHPAARNFLGVRIATEERAFGWIYFADKTRGREFDEEDERITAIMAAKLALLYDNLQLYDLVQRHAAKLQLETSERRRAENALREQGAGLRRAQAMAKLAHVVTGPEGEFLSWSETLPALIGVQANRMPKSTREWLDFLHPEDLAKFRNAAIEAGVEHARRDVEYRLRRVDGATIHVHQVLEPLGDLADVANEGRWFNTLRDMSREFEAAEVLRASEERHRAMFEQAAVGIVHSSVDGILQMVNPKLCAMIGYSRAEVIGRSIKDLTHPEDIQESVDRRARRLMAAGGAYERELRLVRRDQSDLWVHLTTSLIRDANGQPSYFISVLDDISERKRAQIALQHSERRFRALTEHSSDLVMVHDRAGVMQYVSPSIHPLAGYTADEVIGRRYQDFIHPDDIANLLKEMGVILTDPDHAYACEFRYRRKDGEWMVLAAVSKNALDDPAVQGIVVNARDITERKLAETKIKHQNRVYAVLSGINTLIVRVNDREELFRESCRIAVEVGGFSIAWIGVLTQHTLNLQAVASQGSRGEHAATLDIAVGAEAPGRDTLIATAIRERRAVISNDVAREASILLKSEFPVEGLRSAIVLPLLVSGEAVGTLTLVAAEAGFFDEAEVRLLSELAGDIAFAIDYIDKKEKLDYLILYDQLTGLANRTLFIERLNQSIHAAGQTRTWFALAIVDMERFSIVNESLGRQAGDSLIKQVAERLKIVCDASNVGRVAAGQFALILDTARGTSRATRIVDDALRKCFGEPFRVDDTELRASAKAGVALYPGNESDAETLLRNAEAALRKAKDIGERLVIYTSALTERSAGQLSLENQLRRALEKDEFVLHYQPKVDVDKRNIVGVEALIRWQSPEFGLVPPMKFIPLMEETGLILDVGAWALRRAAADHRKWVEQRLSAPRVAVNVSAIQLRQKGFVDAVEQAIIEGTAPTGIDLEITESLVMEDIEGNIEKLKAVRDLGLRIAIDDFGTGYSSLGYLVKLPVQALKIDRSFIITMLKNFDTMTVVSTIISLAHSLKLKVIAEGVDEEEQAEKLRLLRCDEMQGYLFSRPLPFERICEMLAERSS
jgi:PAS domain S-box-containing protein/diguanylate cyclase (GGDEF)-like protein